MFPHVNVGAIRRLTAIRCPKPSSSHHRTKLRFIFRVLFWVLRLDILLESCDMSKSGNPRGGRTRTVTPPVAAACMQLQNEL